MLIIVKKDKDPAGLLDMLSSCGAHSNVGRAESAIIIEVLDRVDISRVKAFDCVWDIIDDNDNLCSSRAVREEDTIIKVGDVKIGGRNLCVMAGPCSIESEEHIINMALNLKEIGVDVLRAGAFKPRTCPYSFQGLGLTGLEYLKRAGKASGLPIVSEIVSERYLEHYDDVDIIQVGARNMQNYELLKELAKIKTPILLKRGVGSSIDEWIMAAEYILAGGNPNVILCERGIKTNDNHNTIDIGAISIIKERTHLPIIVDPSHASQNAKYVKAMSMASIAAGASGLIVEVHDTPQNAMSDGVQCIDLNGYRDLGDSVKRLHNLINY